MNNLVLMSPQRQFLIYYYGYRAQSQIIGSSCALRYIGNRPKCFLISNIAKSCSHIISPPIALKVHLRHDYHTSVRDAKFQLNWTTDKWEISIKTGWLLTLQPQPLNNSWHISGLASWSSCFYIVVSITPRCYVQCIQQHNETGELSWCKLWFKHINFGLYIHIYIYIPFSVRNVIFVYICWNVLTAY